MTSSNGSNQELTDILNRLQAAKGNLSNEKDVVLEVLQNYYLSEDEELKVSEDLIKKIVNNLPIKEINSYQQLKTYLSEIIYNM